MHMSIFKRCSFIILALTSFSSVWAASSSQYSAVLDTTTVSSLSAFLGAIIGAFFSYRSTRRRQFTDTVTLARLEFIKEWRECSVRFCEKLLQTIDNTQSSRDGNQRFLNNVDSIEYYYNKLLFMCNPTKPESYIDKVFVDMLKQLYTLHLDLCKKECKERVKKEQDLLQILRRLVAMIQANLALEWHGVLAESQKGNLSDNQKEKLRQDYYKNYLEYVKKNVIK